MRMYTGPSISMQARTAMEVSMPSAGQITVILGIARMTAKSSVQWWVVPACPKLMPAWVAMIFTGTF